MNNLRSGILVKYLPTGEFFFLSHYVFNIYGHYGYVVRANEYYRADEKDIVHSSYFNTGDCELLVEQLPIYSLSKIKNLVAESLGEYVVPVKYEVGDVVRVKKLDKDFELVGYKVAPGNWNYLYICRSTDENNMNECFDFLDTEITRVVKVEDKLHPYALPTQELPLLTNWEMFFLLLKAFAQAVLDLVRKG